MEDFIRDMTPKQRLEHRLGGVVTFLVLFIPVTIFIIMGTIWHSRWYILGGIVFYIFLRLTGAAK